MNKLKELGYEIQAHTVILLNLLIRITSFSELGKNFILDKMLENEDLNKFSDWTGLAEKLSRIKSTVDERPSEDLTRRWVILTRLWISHGHLLLGQIYVSDM